MNRLAAAALTGALAVGTAGCCACTTSQRFERRAGTGDAPAAAPLAPPALHVLHFGDFGDATCQQAGVAAGIADAQRRRPFDLAFHAGDNLYECGPEVQAPGASACAFAPDGNTVPQGSAPSPDRAFQFKFEGALGDLVAAKVPIYLCLGNHDVAGWGSCLPRGADPVATSRTKACLEVAHASPAWRMPARHYVVDQPAGAPIARFIVLDTNVLFADYGGFTLADEAAFLAGASAGCDTLPCFVVAHHPAATAGRHASDFTPAYAARAEQLVAAAGGRLRGWLAGHDHDLQHLRTAGGLDVFVSGNGARDRTDERFERAAPAGAALLYGSVSWGYALLDVSADGYTWRVENERGSPLYCCAARRAAGWSACEPARCD